MAQVGDLFGGDAVFSAYGRANVNSKWASDQRRNPQLRQSLEFGVDQLAAHLRLLHLHISPEQLGVVRGDLNRHDEAAEPAPGQRIDESHEQPAEQSALVAGSPGDTSHEASFART